MKLPVTMWNFQSFTKEELAERKAMDGTVKNWDFESSIGKNPQPPLYKKLILMEDAMVVCRLVRKPVFKGKFQEATKSKGRLYGFKALETEIKKLDERWQPMISEENICIPIRPKKKIELCHDMKNPNEF